MNYTYQTPIESGYNVSQGVDKFFAWIQYQEPGFINYFLIMVWTIVFIGGSVAERKLTSEEQFAKWFLIASVMVFMITLILGLTADLGVEDATVISLAAVIVGVAVMYMSREIGNRNE